MTILMEVAAGLIAVALIIGAFLGASPAGVANVLRLAPTAILMVAAALLAALGRFGPAGVAAALAAGWFFLSRQRKRENREAAMPASGRSMVRTAAIEMELDHATGALDGLVLAGTREGERLARLGKRDLLALYRELGIDFESRQLLEAYLDSRFPVWREHAQANVGGGLGGAPGSGPMTKQEAYKVLGLEAGAAAADVRKAHRRLMQRLDPDVGRGSFLAARINEAKDILLSDHD